MAKKGIHTRVDEVLLKRFKQFVIEKYGSLHGNFQTEVQQALAHWLNLQGLDTHTNAQKINPGKPRSQQKIDAIVGWLRENGFTNQFSMAAWKRACIHTVGSDERTVQKYLGLARQFGKVKHYTGAVWEIV